MSEHDENTIYTYYPSEIVDAADGVVIDDRMIDFENRVRAFSYEEYVKKKHSEVMISDADRKMFSTLWRAASKLDIPRWLVFDALWFLKKARVLKTRVEFKGKPLYTFKEKFIYAVFFVLATRYNLTSVVNKIANMPCSESGERCYQSRKRGDREFRRYLRSVRYFASFIYANKTRDPISMLSDVCNQYRIPESVCSRARHHVSKMGKLLSGRKIQTVVVAALKLALDEVLKDGGSVLVLQLCRSLGVSEIAVRNFIKQYLPHEHRDGEQGRGS